MTYSMGGSDSITENYSMGNTASWQESWQDTTTETADFSINSKVPNNKCAVVYRQAVRHVRVGNLYNYDLCGVRGHVGELYFNEWSWSPNIAVGDTTCDEDIPASTLPSPMCFMACP